MDSKYPAQAKTMSERQSGNQTGTTIQEGGAFSISAWFWEHKSLSV